ncbi:XF1762 family protein (plasmid) [Streptomyces hebeiensis]
MPDLHLTPVRSREARSYCAMWHRHHPPPVGQIFALGVADEHGVLRGVAVVGRPVARMLDNGQTLEVTRTACDGTPNANSMLYGAAWRAAKALGYTRLITYTQAGESGATDPAERVDAALRLLEAVHRARGLGWRTITVDRLVRIANGEATATPPDPAIAPKSARGTYHR